MNANWKDVAIGQSTASMIERRIGVIEIAFEIVEGAIKTGARGTETMTCAMTMTEEGRDTMIVVRADEIGIIETEIATVMILWSLHHTRETEIAIETIQWVIDPTTGTEIIFEMTV